MADQTDTPVENEEATNNTLEASVEKEQAEQPSRKSKGSSKTTDKRRRTTSSSADSASGDESSESDSNGEGDSSSSSSSEANPKRKKSASSPKHVGDADYRRFDTGAQAHTKLELTNDMHKYLNEKFKIYVKDKAIQESVLDSNPVPDAESLKIPKVDGYLNEIFDTLGKSYGRESDGTLSKTQARINNVMGPLGKLWLNLEKIRTDDSTDELDLFDCLKLVEQSVTLLGQANVSLTYARRLSILGRLTGDMKKAKKLLSKHESSLSSSHKNLFGKRFYKALSKATKIRKSTKDISQHLAGSSKPSRPSAYKGSPLRRDSYRGRGPRDSHQPFRGMPSSRGRGGGRTVSFKPRPPSRPFNKGKSVRFRFKRRSPDSQSPIAGSTLPGGISSVCSPSSTVHGAEHHPCKPKPPSGGAAATFSEQLEITDTGSVHFENDRGSTDSLCRTPKAGTGPLSDLSQPAGKACDRTGNCRNVAERGDSGGLPPERGIYKYSFLSEKERWGEQTCNQLKTVEQFCCLSTFQNGGAALAKAFSPEGRLDDKNRSEGCLLYCANRSRAPAAPSFYLWGTRYHFTCLPFGLGPAPLLFAKLLKPVVALLRRLGLRMIIYLDDIIIFNQTLEGENDPTYSDLQKFNSGEKSLSENSLSDYWETDLIYTGSFSSTPPLPTFAKAPSKGFVDGQGVRDRCPSERGLSGRPSVVDRPNVQLEWSLDNHTSPRLDNNDGCVAEGLGGSVPGEAHKGTLDTGGIQFSSHKCFGAESSSFCCEGLHSQSKAASCPPENGQQDSSCLLVEDGGDTVPCITKYSPGTVGICPKQADNPDCRISAEGIKPRSRLGIKTFQGFQQLETQSNSVPGIRSPVGSPDNRSVCRSYEYSASNLYKLVPRPICSWDGCISDSLDKSEGLQFSTFLNDMSVSGEDPKGSGDNCPDNTNLAYTSVVPSPSRDVVQTANSAAPSERSVAFPQLAATPSSSSGPPVISGLDGYRQNLLADGISEQTSELLRSHSWRTGTAGAYNSAWKQWSSWCRQRKIDPFCSSVASVADYLTEMLKQGKSYRTINSHRSAISAFHPPIGGVRVGQHELICKVVGACFNANPPQPRYVVTWDVDKVLDYIHGLGDNSTLSNKWLTLKLSILLALSSAGRCSDLRALDVRYMSIKDSSIVFELAQLTKSRKKGQNPIKQTFEKFEDDPLLCVFSTITCYLERSKGWRADSNKHQLLLSYVKPHKGVVPCTIAGWLVQLMNLAGIDTSEFRAHSVRGASTSKAKAKGLSCKEIMEIAKWRKESTFRRHYLREVACNKQAQDSFQAVVLQG
ncbi:hypothetical protein ACROYT_G038697 [Oculina patagonica]